MFTLIQHLGITLAVCVAIGAATSWWMFGRDRPSAKKGDKG